MNAKATTYCLAVISAAVVLLPLQPWQALWTMPPIHLLGLALLTALAVISEYLGISAVVGRHRASSSIAFIPFFAAALLFPPPAAVLTAVFTSAFTQLFVHKRGLLRGTFNASQAALSMAAANAAFLTLGGNFGSPIKLEMLNWRGPVSLCALALTFFVLNQAFVSVAIAFINSDRVSTVLNRVVSAGGGNLLNDILASPVAVVVAVLYGSFGWGGLLIGTLPLFTIRYTYLSLANAEQANKDLLSVLVKTIETRDPYTSGHSIRVSILARAIAEDMNLGPARVDRIEMAALVHDIGKVDAVYASIISKEGSLSDNERKVIVTHAAKGAEFLETLSSFRPDVISGVRHHHERFDGTGYPDGLAGEQIPLPARIIQLCDSIDAMLSDRPYRKALSVDHVRAELTRCAGSQFDPKIVGVILRKNTLERAAALVRPDKAKPHLIMASA